MTSSDKYIIVSSDGNFNTFPKNKSSDFSISLDPPFDFGENEWEVGMPQISYPKSWITFGAQVGCEVRILHEMSNLEAENTSEFQNITSLSQREAVDYIQDFCKDVLKVELMYFKPKYDNDGNKLSTYVNHTEMGSKFEDSEIGYIQLTPTTSNALIGISDTLMDRLGLSDDRQVQIAYSMKYYQSRMNCMKVYKSLTSFDKSSFIPINEIYINSMVTAEDKRHTFADIIYENIDFDDLKVLGTDLHRAILFIESKDSMETLPNDIRLMYDNLMIIQSNKANRSQITNVIYDRENLYWFKTLFARKGTTVIYTAVDNKFGKLLLKSIGLSHYEPHIITEGMKLVQHEHQYALKAEEKERLEMREADFFHMSIAMEFIYRLWIMFTEGIKLPTPILSKRSFNINQIQRLYIYMNCVQQIQFNTNSAKLLKILSGQDGEYGKIVNKEFYNFIYVPVMKGMLNILSIKIVSDDGTPIPFEWGTVLISLHFRRRQPILENSTHLTLLA